MEGILSIFVLFVSIIVITEILNEKMLKIPNNIALLIVSFFISVMLLLGVKFNIIDNEFFLVTKLNSLRIDEVLLDGFLCFMLFAGASKIQFSKFVSNIKSIVSLSLLTTIIGTIVYGCILYIIAYVINLPINFWSCLLLGAIISPTDPIAVTGILEKSGLSKSLTSVIEGESLFNDGMGIALFIFVKNMITQADSQNFLFMVFKNIFGAIFVSLVISWILFKLLKQTKNPYMHILISMLDVSLCYIICETFGFSGIIASAICGIYFSYQNKKCERWKAVVDSNNLYNDFWNIVDEFLSGIMFVFIGLTVVTLPFDMSLCFLIPIAIIVNIISRFFGVFYACMLIGKKNLPGKYDLSSFTSLMTLCALRGGVSLAMALSVASIFNEKEYIIIVNITMITILFTVIVQGLLTPKIYKKIEKDRMQTALVKK